MSHVIAAEVFPQVEQLLWKLTHQFVRSFGHSHGTKDEVFSEASNAFVTACRTYDNDLGAFTTWLQKSVWCSLLVFRRKSIIRWKREEPYYDTASSSDHAEFSLVDLIDSFSDDARIIFQLTVKSPKELQGMLLKRRTRRDSAKASIKQYLQGLGWTAKRVKESFAEIRRAIG